MDFINYYQSIKDRKQKRDIRNLIIESCKIQFSTFYSWMSRKRIPPLAQEKINEVINQLKPTN